jgi:hypothetical protein
MRLLPSLAVFIQNPFYATYFLPTAAKSKQEIPLEGNALHPQIALILQVALSRSRRRTAQSPIPRGVRMAIDAQNGINYWRALSRGYVKSIVVAD